MSRPGTLLLSQRHHSHSHPHYHGHACKSREAECYRDVTGAVFGSNNATTAPTFASGSTSTSHVPLQAGQAAPAPHLTRQRAELPAASCNFVNHHPADLVAPHQRSVQHLSASPFAARPTSFPHFFGGHHSAIGRRRAVPAGLQHRMAEQAGGYGASHGISDEELAQMRELSQNYQPEATGPLVSERIPTTAIAEEYAAADPAYRVKTANIPSQYSFYRSCRGDGHCGWRAVAFCYYETLFYTSDKAKLQEELVRMRSLSNLAQAGGLDQDIYGEWEEDTLDLLKSLSKCASSDQGNAELMAAFGEGGIWQSIITYLKILTSSYIKSRPDQYAPFCEPQTVEEFVRHNVEPAQCEIEHVGLNALFDVLLKPATIALEVMYLDRSAGTELVTHRFEPTDQPGMSVPSAPTVRLLYRPGHYDILYAFGDAAVQSPAGAANAGPPQPVTVALATPDPIDGYPTPHQELRFAGLMPIIPGMSSLGSPGMSGGDSLWMPPPSTPSGLYPATSGFEFHAQPVGISPMPHEYESPQAAIKSDPPTPGPSNARQGRRSRPGEPYNIRPAPASSSTSYGVMPLPPSSHSEMFVPGASMAPQFRSPAPPPPPGPPLLSPSNERFPFRPSNYIYESGVQEQVNPMGAFGGADPAYEFKSSVFRNSHHWPSHFQNPEFHPAEWTVEELKHPPSGKRKSTTS